MNINNFNRYILNYTDLRSIREIEASKKAKISDFPGLSLKFPYYINKNKNNSKIININKLTLVNLSCLAHENVHTFYLNDLSSFEFYMSNVNNKNNDYFKVK